MKRNHSNIFWLFFIIFTASFMAFARDVPAPEEIIRVCKDGQITACIYKEYLQEDIDFQTIQYERTIDGDTFVGSGKTIRIWGIDAPEKKSDFHLASKLMLKTLIQQGNLQCKNIDIDIYDRYVMHCFIDKMDVGSLIVQMGMAIDYKKYSGGYYQEEQKVAKENARGVWKK